MTIAVAFNRVFTSGNLAGLVFEDALTFPNRASAESWIAGVAGHQEIKQARIVRRGDVVHVLSGYGFVAAAQDARQHGWTETGRDQWHRRGVTARLEFIQERGGGYHAMVVA